MNRSVSVLCRTTSNVVLQQACRRQFPLRRYVNWTPDKSTNKKGKIPPASSPPKSPPPTSESQSPAELEKEFKPTPPVEAIKQDPNPEPQLLKLKNNKTFNQWEREWNERVWRAGQLTLIVGVFISAYAIAAGYVHLPYGMNYRASKLPKEGSEEEIQYLKRVESALHSLPIVQQLSQNKDWIKTVGIFSLAKEDIAQHLTVGVLSGTGRITVKPVTFYNDKTKEFVVVMHVGQDVCGHRGLVHGGFLATVLDECLGKTAITTLSKEFDSKGKRRQVWPEDRIIVTANLNINYRSPTKVNQFLVIKSILTESTDRKAKAKGRIETMGETPVLLCEGEGLFVKPTKEGLKNILGK